MSYACIFFSFFPEIHIFKQSRGNKEDKQHKRRLRLPSNRKIPLKTHCIFYGVVEIWNKEIYDLKFQFVYKYI